MQLKIQRSQRAGGITGGTVFFCLDVRADYASEEQNNIRRYKLGGQVIYNSKSARNHLENMGHHLNRVDSESLKDKASGLARGVVSLAMAKMSLNISIASLGRGHHIECKDLEELLEAEDTVRSACKNVTRYLEIAETFDGSETVIEYDKGEERIHIAQSVAPLIEYLPEPSDVLAPPRLASVPSDVPSRENFDAGVWLSAQWFVIERRLMVFAASKGWNATQGQIRLASVTAAYILVVLLVLLVKSL